MATNMSRTQRLREAVEGLLLHLYTATSDSFSSAYQVEGWKIYTSTLRPLLLEVPPAWVAIRVLPIHRSQLAAWLSELAIARLEWSAYPASQDALEEIRLWELCFALDRHGTERREWCSENHYVSPAQRLADLYRRVGRTDPEAIALLTNFTDDATLRNPEGTGGHYRVLQLIYTGACITSKTPFVEVSTRRGLCLRLKMHNFHSPWVEESLHYANQFLAQK